ncbi:AAA-like domain-containing protein [Phormidium sp. LEGE 05292]|uniref:AAA-like domain-containing protein n=1 Tax=[Phormidium] sp. LEGE 05292 TaxID=767427 RepID=UPI0018818B5B|nr:AAA-like domain-containing protein [Phormidium sp. LEGE 05292]MBE9226070.1 AAA-like domain-containing protein [Phormidium sp. LEGE 05292]
MSTPTRKKKTILFLAANPKNTSPLSLEQEVKEIEHGLQRAKKRHNFQLEKELAVTPRDMQRAVLGFNPEIVHFAGHGAGEDGLAFEDGNQKIKLVSAKALASLFELFKDQVECVVLNACYSEVQAKAIAHHIPYVIGMKQAVGDNAAREFAVGFYDALGAGKTVEFAYKMGCVSISMAGIPEELTPILLKSSDFADSDLPEELIEDENSDLPDSSTIEESSGRSTIAQPISLTELDNPEGSVSLNSPLYIERPPIESDCYETIVKPGALIRVKAPRQMGKTSLLQRILHHAKQQGHQTAYLNFQAADAEFLSSIDKFLQWFSASVANELNLDDRLTEYWKGVLGSKNKCSNYFQRYLLTSVTEPLTLGLDEVDQIFHDEKTAQEFFGLLRAWHERSKNEPTWQKLRLVIVHSKEVYIPLNINQSPFNVGLPIELPDLNSTQVTELIKRHGLNWSNHEIEQLIGMVDGHPYLLRKALYNFARGQLTLEKFLESAPTEAGIYDDHLRRHLTNIKADPKLEAAMKQVISASVPVRLEQMEAFKLRSMGLVELRGNDVVPLCNLYRLYFKDMLGVR